MNLVRLGHYFSPTGTTPVDPDNDVVGRCSTALVVDVREDSGLDTDTWVNLAVWNHDGGAEVRRDVPVVKPGSRGDSFHLSGDCPWKR